MGGLRLCWWPSVKNRAWRQRQVDTVRRQTKRMGTNSASSYHSEYELDDAGATDLPAGPFSIYERFRAITTIAGFRYTTDSTLGLHPHPVRSTISAGRPGPITETMEGSFGGTGSLSYHGFCDSGYWCRFSKTMVQLVSFLSNIARKLYGKHIFTTYPPS